MSLLKEEAVGVEDKESRQLLPGVLVDQVRIANHHSIWVGASVELLVVKHGHCGLILSIMDPNQGKVKRP